MKKNYSELLKDPRWQKKRLHILERDHWACKLCGDTETTLNVHHKKYVKNKSPWDYPNETLVTLCEHCHTLVTKEFFSLNGNRYYIKNKDHACLLTYFTSDKEWNDLEILVYHLDTEEIDHMALDPCETEELFNFIYPKSKNKNG